ncbi:MAG: hypothetical protein FWC46_09900, partial [Actinomycetia bacterium]|nr:hypothetical protein [Actinomycetes bacterium]
GYTIHVKRRDLMRRITAIARAQGIEPVWCEGGAHTKVVVGSRSTVIPRHKEIKEPLARQIIRDIEED